MAKCDVCGNECAIHMPAPTCPHYNCKVIGHGVEAGDQIYCCVHCAEESVEESGVIRD